MAAICRRRIISVLENIFSEKSQVSMTPKWPWILQGQMYRIYVPFVPCLLSIIYNMDHDYSKHDNLVYSICWIFITKKKHPGINKTINAQRSNKCLSNTTILIFKKERFNITKSKLPVVKYIPIINKEILGMALHHR